MMSLSNIFLALLSLQVGLATMVFSPLADVGNAITQSAVTMLGIEESYVVQETREQIPKKAVTTVFWVGETADRNNDYIHNSASFWDPRWEEHFGGYDNPGDRCGYYPCAFTPKENPFYVALPYSDFDENGERKDSVEDIPWFDESIPEGESVVKNHWVRVSHGQHTCYGQWEDVGPIEIDDVAYVFGNAEEPQNTFGQRAGLDISPALRDCLDVADVSVTYWSFVDATDVPPGPWKDIVTTH